MQMLAVEAAMEGPVPAILLEHWRALAGEHRDSGSYEVSFETVYPYGGNATACAVVSRSPHAAVLEYGHGGYHLPTAIDWGAAEARGTAKGKAGKRRIAIPFRHGTPSSASGGIGSGQARRMMPQTVYNDALAAMKGDAKARRVRRMSETELLMRSRRSLSPAERMLQAGTRMSRPGGPGHERAYTWKARKFAGMQTKQQYNPVTGRTTTQFTTFRMLTEDSAGWFIPPAPPLRLGERAREEAMDSIRSILGEAGRDDIARLVSEELG